MPIASALAAEDWTFLLENEFDARYATMALTAELPSMKLVEREVDGIDYFDDVHRAISLHIALRQGGTLWRLSQDLARTRLTLTHTSK